MVLDKISDLLIGRNPKPNNFTVTMGNYVRQARKEAGLSQTALAKMIFLGRATLSDIENGKAEIGAITLALLAAQLNKPVEYFFAKYIKHDINLNMLSPQEKEIIMLYRKIPNEDLRNIAIDELKTISK